MFPILNTHNFFSMADRITSNGCSHWRNLYPDDHHAHVCSVVRRSYHGVAVRPHSHETDRVPENNRLARGRSRHGIQRQVHPCYRNLSFDPCQMSDKLAQKDCLF